VEWKQSTLWLKIDSVCEVLHANLFVALIYSFMAWRRKWREQTFQTLSLPGQQTSRKRKSDEVKSWFEYWFDYSAFKFRRLETWREEEEEAEEETVMDFD